MAKECPKDYKFFPKTWQLPADSADLKAQFSKKKNKTFIIKPVNMCQGRGIYLVRRWEDIDLRAGEQVVAQRYMSKPYLIDNLKFDLRVYALIFGVDPLRVFVFSDGLARFATEEYVGPAKGNLENLYMHLTNYAIQKRSDNFVRNEDAQTDNAHKRSLTQILAHIRENEPNFCTEDFMTQIDDIAVKTCISA